MLDAGFWFIHTSFGDFNELYEGFSIRCVGTVSGSHQPLLDVVEGDKGFVISVEMPGSKKEDIAVALENGVPAIKVEKIEEKTEKNGFPLRGRDAESAHRVAAPWNGLSFPAVRNSAGAG